jgi:hypothetical protein
MNILLSNNIVVTVTQSPKDPLPGDTVVFQATQYIENTISYSDNNNYFYSYNWLVSRDGGSTYITAGPDLDTLTLENISSSFFNEIYRLEVTLIDLDNLLLTEDGDVLSAEVGGVLLVDSTGLLSIQNTTNNNVSSVSIANTGTSETAVDIIDSMAVTDEAATFDPLIDAEMADTINSGQGISARNSVAQNINNDPLDVFLEDDTLPNIVLPTQTQNISIQTAGYAKITNESSVGCNTVLKYRECVPYDDFFHDGLANYASLNECVSANACNFNSSDTDVTIKTNDKIGTIPTKRIEIWDTQTVIKTTNFVCCLDPETVCDGGLASCSNGDWTIGNIQGADCDPNSYEDGPGEPTLATSDDDELCGCKDPMVVYAPVTADGSGGFVLASFSGLPLTGDISPHLRPYDRPAPPAYSDGNGNWVFKSVRTASAALRAMMGGSGGSSPQPPLRPGVNWVAVGATVVVGLIAAGVVGAVIWWRNKPVQAYTCAKRYFKKRIQCKHGPLIEISTLDKRTSGSGGVAIDYSDKEQDINKGASPQYNCICQRNGQTYSGSVGPMKEEKNCDWYIKSYTGKPGSSCECSLTNGSQLEGASLSPKYSYSIPAIPTTCDLPAYVDSGCLFGVSAGEYADCYFKGDKCGAECDGPLCCNSPKATIFVLSNGGSSAKACNQSISIQLSEDVHMGLAACPAPTSANAVTIQQVTIIERPRTCGEIADPSKNLFASYNEAKAAAQKQIQPGDVLIISKFKPIKDISKTKQLSPEIKRDGIVIAPALNSYYDTVYDTYEKIGDECDMCKVWYSVSVGGSSYACDSGPISCGAHSIPKQCNNPNSPDATPIKIATIDKITSYNATNLEFMKNNPNEFFPDCGAATGKAESLVSKGFICTTW